MGNDPVNLVDPTGMQAEEIIVTGGRVARACGHPLRAAMCGGAVLIGSLLFITASRNDALSNPDRRELNISLPTIHRNEEVDLEDADDVEGAKPEDIEAEAKARGWTEQPAKNGKGNVFRSPNGKQGIRVMRGGGRRTGKDAEIKSGGPYAHIEGGKDAGRNIPLDGNSVLSIRGVLNP